MKGKKNTIYSKCSRKNFRKRCCATCKKHWVNLTCKWGDKAGWKTCDTITHPNHYKWISRQKPMTPTPIVPPTKQECKAGQYDVNDKKKYWFWRY